MIVPAEVAPAVPVWERFAGRYDRNPALSDAERSVLRALIPHSTSRWLTRVEGLERLVTPLLDALSALTVPPSHPRARADLAALDILRASLRRDLAYWGWDTSAWIEELDPTSRHVDSTRRQLMIGIAYLLGCFRETWLLGPIHRQGLVRKIFGSADVDASEALVVDMLCGWGYGGSVRGSGSSVHRALYETMLLTGSPHVTEFVLPAIQRVHALHPGDRHISRGVHLMHRILHARGLATEPPPQASSWEVVGPDPRWTAVVERWFRTATCQRTTRRSCRTVLLKAGRWLIAHHPEVCEPSGWTRELCAEWIAAVDRMHVGDYNNRSQPGTGKPLSASAKAGYIGALRVFFRDCQEWEWIERRFDPTRALVTPRTIRNSIGPNPRVIDDATWAKLLWAGLNLTDADVRARTRYPIELLHALALAWLFSGSRSNEIVRLRVGCVRWQSNDDGDPTCLLDIPVTKTSTAFTRPVDPILGRALEAWQQLRPDQPKLVDWRTGEQVDMLFALRGQPVGKNFLNLRLIPALCEKAGVPRQDVRGTITSHRARATIASHLYNAKEPFSLAELQQWLGHRSPRSTQYYAELTPTTLSRAYRDAGYFARNLRTIEVLIDRGAVESGDAASGKPWRYFDLGHGFCSYTFFEQCAHRMACARCDFYRPKASSATQLVEALANLERLTKEIPLTDDERAAVDDGAEALTALLERLEDTPTPAGPTPRELSGRMTRLPVVPVQQQG